MHVFDYREVHEQNPIVNETDMKLNNNCKVLSFQG